MGKFTGKTCRLLTMLLLTLGFFLVEIIVGYMTNSMALVADSFHMLSDVLALLIGFFAVRISRKKSKKNTFGWARAEVLGALVNAVFLVALCFSILIEALKRIIMLERIQNVDLLLWVGSLGLIVNLIGLVLFHDHSHGSHSHQHSSISSTSGLISNVANQNGNIQNIMTDKHASSRANNKSTSDILSLDQSMLPHERLGSFDKLHMSGTKYIEAAVGLEDEEDGGDYNYRSVNEDVEDNEDIFQQDNRSKIIKSNGNIKKVPNYSVDQEHAHLPKVIFNKDASNDKVNHEKPHLFSKKFLPTSSGKKNGQGSISSPAKITSSNHLNMRGVFLHVLGDALGSVIVIISALSIKYFKGDWKYYIDPGMSLILVLIILCTTAPLLKESALILLQTVPPHLRIDQLCDRLTDIDGILAVHDFHIWQLAGNKIIATAHIRCRNIDDYMKIAGKVKEFFHREGIHSTTIQPEFVEAPPEEDEKCLLLCQGPLDCAPKTCCGKNPLQQQNSLITGINNPAIVAPDNNSINLNVRNPNNNQAVYDGEMPEIKILNFKTDHSNFEIPSSNALSSNIQTSDPSSQTHPKNDKSSFVQSLDPYIQNYKPAETSGETSKFSSNLNS